MSAATETPTPATAGTEPSRRRACLFGRASRIVSRARFEQLYAGRAKRAGRYLVAYWDAAPADAKPGANFPGIYVSADVAPGVKCPRCWVHSTAADLDGLCPRCAKVVSFLK